MESILVKTVSYEDWIIERLQDKQEVSLYIEACLDVFREDGDLDGLLSALKLVMRAQNRNNLRPLHSVVGLSSLYAPLTGLPDSDDFPLVQLEGWPATVPEETLSHPFQPDSVNPYSPPLPFPTPSGLGKEGWDNTTPNALELQYLYTKTLLDSSTLAASMLEKD